MGVKRYELDEAQWVRIEPLLPGKASDPGRPGRRSNFTGQQMCADLQAYRCDPGSDRYARVRSHHPEHQDASGALIGTAIEKPHSARRQGPA